jgi:two-component system, LytTR family, response regulator
MNLKALIVDDEPVARRVIREYIEDIDYLELAGMAENPLKADAILNEQPIDLLFLDINMPKLSGIDFLRVARRLPRVIITTAYAQYALEGFELEVTDYLVKPFSFERFLKACNKVRDYYLLTRRAENMQAGGSQLSPGGNNPQPAGISAGDHFFVKCDNRMEKITWDELVYIEAMMNYIVLHTTTRRLIVYLTMKGILEQLPADRFIRVHKSFIVNRSGIKSIEGNIIHMGNAQILISQNYHDKAIKEILADKVIKRS